MIDRGFDFCSILIRSDIAMAEWWLRISPDSVAGHLHFFTAPTVSAASISSMRECLRRNSRFSRRFPTWVHQDLSPMYFPRSCSVHFCILDTLFNQS